MRTTTQQRAYHDRRQQPPDFMAEVVDWIGALMFEFRLELLLLAVAGGAFAALYRAAHWSLALAAGTVVGACVSLLLIPAVRRALLHALRVASVRRAWQAAWQACGLAPVFAGKIVPVSAGWQISVRVSAGSSFEHLVQASELLAAALRLRELRVQRSAHDAGSGTVTLVQRDPLAAVAGLGWPWARMPDTSLWDPIPLGIGEHGPDVSVRLVERNVLLGGEPGAGKSVALSVLLAAAALDLGTELWLLDGKRVELAAWEPCAQRLAGPDIGEAIELLEAVQQVMEDRYRALLATGRRKIDQAAALPLHVVACDELAFYLTVEDRKQRARFAELLRDLVARGRAAGIIVLAATQKPAADVVPSALRDLFGFRLAFRCTTPQASDTILGQGWASQGYSAATIRPGDRGVGFLLAEDGLPVRLPTFYLDDQAIDQIARRAAVIRQKVS